MDEDKGGEVHGVHCDMSTRPADRESCSLQPCEYVWITGEWSEVWSWGFCHYFQVNDGLRIVEYEGRNVEDSPPPADSTPENCESSDKSLCLPGPESFM